MPMMVQGFALLQHGPWCHTLLLMMAATDAVVHLQYRHRSHTSYQMSSSSMMAPVLSYGISFEAWTLFPDEQ